MRALCSEEDKKNKQKRQQANDEIVKIDNEVAILQQNKEKAKQQRESVEEENKQVKRILKILDEVFMVTTSSQETDEQAVLQAEVY
jgi:hypothetical protein